LPHLKSKSSSIQTIGNLKLPRLSMTCCSEQPSHCRVWQGSRSVCPATGQLASAGEPSNLAPILFMMGCTRWNPSPQIPNTVDSCDQLWQLYEIIWNIMKLYEIIASQTSLPSIYSQTNTFPTVKMLLSYVTRQIWTTHIFYISWLITKNTNITTHHHQKKIEAAMPKKRSVTSVVEAGTLTHTCSEQSLRILMWNASYVQKHFNYTWLEGVGEKTRENSKRYHRLVQC